MICTNASCKNHGHDQPQSRFCPECGGALAEAPKPPVPSAVALPPGYNFPAIGKSIVGGDQNISNTSIYHQDETKSVRKCAVSGRQAEVTRGYVCPSCSLWVHEEHFDRVQMRCDTCRLAASNYSQKQYEEKVTNFLSDGQISREELMELRTLGVQVGLSIPEQDNVIAKLKKQIVRSEAKGLSILDKTKLKSILRKLATARSEPVDNLEPTWTSLKLLHRGNPANAEIATLLVVGITHALQGRATIQQYRDLHETLKQAEPFSSDSAHKYLVMSLFYRLASEGAETNIHGKDAEFIALAQDLHHESVAQLETVYPESPECIAVQLATLLDDYYTNGCDSNTEVEVKDFILAGTEQLAKTEIEQALLLVRKNVEEARDFVQERLAGEETTPLVQFYYSTLFRSSAVAGAKVLTRQLEKAPSSNTDDKLRLLRKAAELGDATAQYDLGILYEDGLSVPKDIIEAAKWYRKAADQGHADGQNRLGFCYDQGTGVPKDIKEAIKWYLKAANQGQVSAQGTLGILYQGGRGVPSDMNEAVKWYRKAADQGDTFHQINLGTLYEDGFGVSKDIIEAAKWYRKAADQGDAGGQYKLGLCYAYGTGVPQDLAEAGKWFRKAADQGNAKAQNYLGVIYENGLNVSKDILEAAKWYRKAADQGDATGQYNLGLCYAYGTGVPQDYANAAKWYRKAADQGDADAQANLGNLYHNGTGVPQDYAEAEKWFRKAAELGDATAQYYLGVIYENGLNVSKDILEAAKWYRKAAEQGNDDSKKALKKARFRDALTFIEQLDLANQGDSTAQANLGILYHNGTGVPQDYAEAEKWYRKAADQGNATAQANIGILYENGLNVSKDILEAAKWYRKAAEQGNDYSKKALKKAPLCDALTFGEQLDLANQNNAAAQNYLGWACEIGKGTSKSIKQALVWYNKAAANGNSESLLRLAKATLNGELGLKSAPNESVALFEKAEKGGNAEATKQLDVWRATWKRENDFKRHCELANSGTDSSAIAAFYVAWCYEHGIGVNAQPDTAVKFYTSSKDRGHMDAAFRLATIYLWGKLKQSTSSAKAKLNMEAAAEAGHALAKEYLELIKKPKGMWASFSEGYKKGYDSTAGENTINDAELKEWRQKWPYCDIKYISINGYIKDSSVTPPSINAQNSSSILSNLPVINSENENEIVVENESVLAWIDANKLPHASPHAASAPTTIEFVNQRSEVVEIDWIDWSGTPKFYYNLRPGTTYLQNTFAGHVWVISHAGKPLGAVIATTTDSRAEIKDSSVTPPSINAKNSSSILSNLPVINSENENAIVVENESVFIFEDSGSGCDNLAAAVEQLLSGNSEFLIITDTRDTSNETYLQFAASTGSVGGFDCEYRAGSKATHAYLIPPISSSQVRLIVAEYLVLNKQSNWNDVLNLNWTLGMPD